MSNNLSGPYGVKALDEGNSNFFPRFFSIEGLKSSKYFAQLQEN